MSELLKYLIEQVKKHPLGAEALLLVAILTVCLSAVVYVQTNPEAYAVVRDRHAQVAVILLGSLWIASVCWRYADFRALRLISTGTVLLAGVLGSIFVLRSGHVEQLRVRVIFDESIAVSPSALNELISRMQSPLFSVEVDDRPFPVTVLGEGSISDEEARKALGDAGILISPSEANAVVPVLITARNLRSEDWDHLLMTAYDDCVVISTWHVGSASALSDEFVARYVATSVVLETLAAYALRRNGEILKDRTPGLNRGCLHDFHRTRETYVMQAQRPELCDAEAEGIRELFGEGALSAVKAVLKKIGRNS